MTIKIEIGMGKLVDRYTILAIKMKNIADKAKLENVKKEFDYVNDILKDIEDRDGIFELSEELYFVNQELWEVEDELREYEKLSEFGTHFINAARSVYKLNDKRAAIKKQINLLYGSGIIEEKSYK
jgi:hypothetical protein